MILPNRAGLEHLHRIDASGLDSRLKSIEVIAVFSINQTAVPFSQVKMRSREDLCSTVVDLFRFTAGFS